MQIQTNVRGGWVIEHDRLMVSGDTLEEAIVEYGEGMKNRGRLEVTTTPVSNHQ